MKWIISLGLLLVLLTVACTRTKTECALNMINPYDCEFGSYTIHDELGCSHTACRPSVDFGCESLNAGDSYFDRCNTCSCSEQGTMCTMRYCEDEQPEDFRYAQEGEMCGGIAGIICADDLFCVIKDDYPDASGTCIRPK